MPYTLIQQFNTQHAHLKFNGPFQEKTVSWDTHFQTLEYYVKQQNLHAQDLKQFIDIEEIDLNNMKLTVVLKIAEINTATIKKMMIMIRQYKNLSLGRHQYG